MALILPQQSDNLVSPDHSRLHRVMASDGSTPEQAFTLDASGNATIATGAKYQINSVDLAPNDIGAISQDSNQIYAADAGGTDAYAITLAPVPASYTTGMAFNFKANTANTGACSINVNALGVKSIKMPDGTDPTNNTILADQIVTVIYDGTNFQLASGAGSGGGSANTIAVTQTTHGFSAGDVVRSSGTANEYTEAQADSATNAEVAGVVSEVTDANTFTLLLGGELTSGVPAQTAGTVMFLDPSSAGAMAATEPSTAGQVSKPIGIVVESGARMIVSQFRGAEIESSSLPSETYITNKLGTEADGDDNQTFSLTTGSFSADRYLAVYKNGILQREGSGNDYQTSGTTIAVFESVVLDTDLITLVVRSFTTEGIADPFTTAGDIMYRNATVPTRLGIGTNGQILATNAGATAPEWIDAPEENPMTTQGDVIYGGTSGAMTRLAKGTADQLLTMNSGATAPEWADAPSGTPTGALLAFAGSSAPTGFLLCDGSTVSQTTYAALYAVTGHTYGADPGGGDFILPDLRGNIPVGKDTGTFTPLGDTGGAETHTLSEAEMPSHTHRFNTDNGDSSGSSYPDQVGSAADYWFTTSSTGGDESHNNLQPYLVINYIIKT